MQQKTLVRNIALFYHPPLFFMYTINLSYYIFKTIINMINSKIVFELSLIRTSLNPKPFVT